MTPRLMILVNQQNKLTQDLHIQTANNRERERERERERDFFLKFTYVSFSKSADCLKHAEHLGKMFAPELL